MPLLPLDRGPRHGAVTVWLIASLGVIIGVVAIGLDGGRMMEERRRARAAADNAALAAAADLYRNYAANQGTDPAGTAAKAATDSAAANGYANDGTVSVVTVNIPPRSGTFAGQADHVEVIVQSNLKATFGAAIRGADTTVNARAVARGRPQNPGILALAASGAGTLLDKLAGNITVVKGGITVNSTDPAAFTQTGTGQLKADYEAVAGGYSGPMSTVVGPLRTGASAFADPLRALPAPKLTDYTVRSTQPFVTDSDTVTILQPGIYRGGITIFGEGNVTLMPGVYIMDGGGFSVAGEYKQSGTVTATGVVIYNTSATRTAGPIKISIKVNMSPPTDGAYRGISIFQDPALTNSLTLSTSGGISGTIYAPKAAVNLTLASGAQDGAGGDLSVGAVVANTLQIAGRGNLTVDNGSNRPRVPEVFLVE